jgi:tetratricopeptide (TPR) repeat protein
VTRRLAVLALAWLALVAATPLPLTPPPPDIAALVPFAAAPVDKPAVMAPMPPLPPPPVDLPHVPPARVSVSTSEKPIAPLAAPGTAPCFWSWLPSASESLKCGLARLYRGEHDKARESLEQALRSAGGDRELATEARYWLAETWYLLGQPQQADPLFRQVAQEPRAPLAVWALSSSGWTALRAGDFARARDAFGRLATSQVPAAIDGWSRHGLGLALYGLGQFDEAERTWAQLRTRSVPAPIARDVVYWHGETLGRIGRFADAEKELARFTGGGPHAMLESGLIRQGWWAHAGGRAKESLPPLRAAVAMPARPVPAGVAPERDWADAALALALLESGDVAGARQAAQGLRTRRSTLEIPVLLRLAAGAVQARRGADAQAIVQELLGARLDAPTRTWVIIVGGDAQLAAGNRDDARTQYDLARQGDSGLLGAHARLRLAQTNFELREFTQAMNDVAPLLGAPLPTELRNAALLLRGEAAYHAGDYTTAADTFRRALIEVPQANEAAGVRLALGWTALRQGRRDEARRHIVEFVKAQPDHALAGDAVMLAAELAAAAGDLAEARALIDRALNSYPAHPRIEFAKLNRGLLLLRAGKPADAEPIFREWIARAPFPPLVGRAHLGLGGALLAAGKPADAAREFAAAARGGEGAVATLGVAAVALAQGRADEARKTFTDARDAGPAGVTAAASYGLAAVELQRGDAKGFVTAARAALPTASPAMAPWLLYVLTGIAADEKDWPGALDSGKRLVADHPAHQTADDALERIGSAAATARAWPVVHESYALLLARYPKSPFADNAMIALAEAQIHTGRGGEAIATLERFVALNPSHPDAARAWLALARAREGTGQSQAAVEAYASAMRDARSPDVRRDAAAGQARMLVAEKKWGEARSLLHPLIRDKDAGVVAEAAQAIGESYRGEGDAMAAAEYFMTAAYVAPESPAGRKAMLAAAQSFAAARQPDAAAAVYRKLLAQTNLPPDIAEPARQGLSTVTGR